MNLQIDLSSSYKIMILANVSSFLNGTDPGILFCQHNVDYLWKENEMLKLDLEKEVGK